MVTILDLAAILFYYTAIANLYHTGDTRGLPGGLQGITRVIRGCYRGDTRWGLLGVNGVLLG